MVWEGLPGRGESKRGQKVAFFSAPAGSRLAASHMHDRQRAQPGNRHCTACAPPVLAREVTTPRSARACSSVCTSMWAFSAASSTSLTCLGPLASASRRNRCARAALGLRRCFARRRLRPWLAGGFAGEVGAGIDDGGPAHTGELGDGARCRVRVGLPRVRERLAEASPTQ
jgi:hypothetical protein